MLGKLQTEMLIWQEHNFGNRPSHIPLMGVGEELGELSEQAQHLSGSEAHIVELCKTLGRLNHAHIKTEQKIRLNENHDLAGRDAVADMLIYLADYCNSRGWDMQQIAQSTWDEVKQRDWVKFPKNGKTE